MSPPRIMVVSCPGLRCTGPGGPDPRAARLFEQVVTVVTGFCPSVEVVEPGVCAFGARGPARYFGSETALAAEIIAAVADLGAECGIGVADGLFAALLAAGRAGRALVVPPGETARFLAAQPVSVLADRDLAGLLTRLGLGTLGDFAALPVSEVASRFGAPGEAAHRLARGLDLRPLAVRPPAEDLSVAQEFDPPETLAEPVVFTAKALAERMHEGLAARGLACVCVQVRAIWADGRESSRLWRHDGLLSAAGVADRVRWQLDGWRANPEAGDSQGTDLEARNSPGADPQARDLRGWEPRGREPRGRNQRAGAPEGGQDAEGGITALRLTPDQVIPATGQQLALWGESAISDQVARAAMRIQAMLGHEAVLRPALGGGRDSGGRVTPIPFGEKREPRLAADRPWPGRVMGAAPGVVFPAARAAKVTDAAGRVVTVSGRCVVSDAPAWLAIGGEPPRRVTGWAGPWPLSERWWDAAVARRRARFQLATGDGRAWLAVVRDGRWLIEAGYW